MLGLIAAASAVANIASFVPTECTRALVAAKVRCGTVTVPEDRSKPDGRQIRLNIIVIPAKQPSNVGQALFELEGGPGLADTNNVGFYLTDGAPYGTTRDIVLFDQRGTGRSNPLDCPEFDAPDRALQPMFSAKTVSSCRARLGQRANLTKYTTDDAVADLDAVRTALGYRRIDLTALSYGTTLAMRYIALHGDHVRSAILLSAVPPSAMPPRHHATAAQSALDQLILDCAADQACSGRFPNLRADLSQAMAKLASDGTIEPAVAMERLRTKLHSPGGARQVPWIIHRLADGDKSILTSTNERAGFNYYDGVYLTIACSESLPWFNRRRATQLSRRTLFRDYRLARQQEACASWVRAKVTPAFFAPLRSPVPILFISGGRDPVTPANWAREAMRGLSNSRQIIVPWAGHIVDGLSNLETCFDPQLIRFLETADPKAVDERCFAAMAPPPFKIAE